MIRRSIVGMLMLLFGANLFAQQVTISGRVLESDAETPVEGATYVVEGTQLGGYSDESGAFSVKVPRKSEIRILFRYFEQNDTTLVVKTEGGVTDYSVELIYGGGGVTMGTQVITAGRHKQDLEDVVTSMEVINPEKIDIQATNDIEDVLQQGSGVDVIDGQPNIRGSSGYAYGVGSRVMVMLDGLPLLTPDASSAEFSLIPTDNIAQVEVMKGASSVLYGSSALGGVINVITSDAPRDPKTSIRLRGQMYGAPSNPLLDWDGDKNAVGGAINVFHARKIGRHDVTGLVDLWKDTGYRNGEQSLQGRVMAMTKFRPKGVPGLSFGVNTSARFDSSSTFLFWDSYKPADTLLSFGGDTTFNSLGAYSGGNSARSQLNTRFTLDPFIKYLTKSNNIHQYRGRYMRTANTNDTQQSNKNALLYNDYQFTTQFMDERITLVSGATATLNFANGDSLYDGSHQSRNLAAYAQMDAAVTEKLNVTLGARYDHFLIDKSIVEASPIFRVGANYAAWRGGNLRASFGQAFRSPSVAERFTSTNASGLIIEPNTELKVEKGFSAEFGIRQGLRFGNEKRYLTGFVDVAGFMMDFQNMIEFGVKPASTVTFPPPPPVFQARNVADANIKGIEATTFLEVGLDDFFFNITGGVTYINPVNENGLTDSTKLVDLLGTLGPQDAPFSFEAFGMYFAYTLPDDDPAKRVDNPRFLKYRSKWLNRFSATAGYGRYAVTMNYRYKSEIVNIDQFLFVAIPGAVDFVRENPGGFTIVDFIVAADVLENMKLSFHCENAFNKEYAQLPGIIGEQRNFSVQLKYVF